MALHKKLHASEHTNGTDAIQLATPSQNGLMTSTQAGIVAGVADISGGLTQLDARFVNVTGDTINGTLNVTDLSVTNPITGTVTNGVVKTGTPVDNQLAIFTNASTVEGDANLTYASSTLTVGVNNHTAKLVGAVSNARLELRQGTAGAAYNIFNSKIANDTNNRTQMDASGKLEWGDGTSAVDTNLYRDSANILRTDDAFMTNLLYVNDSSTNITKNGSNVMAFTDIVNGTTTLSEINYAVDNFVDANGDTLLGTLTVDSTVGSIDASVNITSTQSTDELLIRDASDSFKLKTISYSDFGNGLSSLSPVAVNWSLASLSVGISGENIPNENDDWASVTYGNGMFVAVSNANDRCMTSEDGRVWTVRNITGNNDSWTSVVFGKGLFVAVSVSGDKIASSPNGITWTVTETGFSVGTPRAICYGNGIFIVGTNSGTKEYAVSSDGKNWTQYDADQAFTTIAYGNGLFVALGINFSFNHSVATSRDGVNWTYTQAPGPIDFNMIPHSLTYGNGKFVAVAYPTSDYYLATSEDGINWTYASGPLGTDDNWRAVCYGDGKYVAVGITNDKIAYSSNGTSWSAADISAFDGAMALRAVCYGDGVFVAVGDGVGDNVVYSGNKRTSSVDAQLEVEKFNRGIEATSIKFTATPTTLSHYEEGTFTPSLTCGSGSVTSYVTQLGSYTRIGNQVTVCGFVYVSAVSSPSGTLRLSGLPFTIKNGGNAYRSAASFSFDNLSTIATGAVESELIPNETVIRFLRGDTTTLQDDMASQLVSNTNVRFQATYFV